MSNPGPRENGGNGGGAQGAAAAEAQAEGQVAGAGASPPGAIPVAPKAGADKEGASISAAVETPKAASPDVEMVNGKKVWRAGTLAYTSGGLAVLFFWLLWGDFAWSIKERSVMQVVQVLLKEYKSSDTLMSVFITFLPQCIALIITPIISYKSDRHRGRWGRRIPYLIIPTPIAAGAIIALAYAPRMGGWLHANLGLGSDPQRAVLLSMGIFWTIFEFASLSAQAVFAAFVNDVVPRPMLGRFYGMFRAVSLLAGIGFNAWLFGGAKEHYAAIFIGVGLVYGIGFAMMCLFVKEGEYPPPPVEDTSSDKGPLAKKMSAVSEYFRDITTKPYYMWVIAAMWLPQVAFLPINLFNYPFSQKVGVDADRYGKLMAFYFTLSLIQTIPLGWLIDKFHPLRVAIVAVVLHALAAIWGGLFANDGSSFGIAFVLTGTLSGTWFTANAALGPALMPRAKFAQYMSVLQILISLGAMAVGPAVGAVLDLTGLSYKLAYQLGFAIDVMGLVATLVVFKKFKALGGTKGYVAPE